MKTTPSTFSGSRYFLMALASSTALAFSTPEMAPSGAHEISEFIEMDVASDSRMEGSKVSVKIENGIAILNGKVLTMDQAERAAERALAAVEVRAVVNQLQLPQGEVSDSLLNQSVKTALLKNPAIDAKRVQVKTVNGRVTLMGEVGTWDEQELAREIVSNVSGVSMIDNRTEVVFDSIRTDSQIEAQLRQLVANDPLYEGLSLSVSVKEGVVKLKGEVGSKGEYDRLVRRTAVTGVFEVSADGLNVNSDLKMEAMGDKHFTQDEMIAALGDAFKMDSRVDAQRIDYKFAEGVVTLDGRLNSIDEKAAAESTARGIPGVIAVSNRIQVQENRPAIAANAPLVKAP